MFESLGNNMKINSSKRLLFTALFLVFFSSLSCAAFKYSGEHGETVYSQLPPKAGQAENIKTKKHHNTSPKSSAVDALERFTRDNADKQRAAQKLAKKKKDAAAQKKNCIAARHNLTIYEGSTNKLVKGQDGHYTRLTPSDRQAKINRARKDIKEFCK
jgi:hypothetical protein